MAFHTIAYGRKKTAGLKRRSGRAIAFLLCFALSMENGFLTVQAAEAETISENTVEPGTAGQYPGEEEQPGEAGGNPEQEEQPGEDNGMPEQSVAGGDGSLEGEEGQTPEGAGNPEGEGVEDPEEPDGSIQEQPETPGESDESESWEEPGQVSGNDMEPVSGNDLPSVSDNDLLSVSGNSLDTEREELIREAREAFGRLLLEKPLMALLYHADSYDARVEADGDSQAAAVLEIGQTLYIRDVEITEDDVWYRAEYLLDGAVGTGYVQSYYLAYSDEDWIAWEEEYLLPVLEQGKGDYGNTAYGMRSYSLMTYAVDTSDISAFPGSYQAALRSLKESHPNWTFVPMKTGLDFNTSVSKEMGDKSLIQKTSSNVEKGWVGDPCPEESGWNYATKPAVAYHMDPRNFLTETYIFQFEQLTFNASYHTEEAVQTFLNGTFMKGVLPDDGQGRTYARAFYEIGSGRKLSPIHLASRVYQEQGQGTSGLISGTYPGYQGYYNFFNVGVNGASTEEKIVKGLTYAKDKGWDTRYKSLEGGAATIGNNYILKGQDTIYLEKFNVNKNSPHGAYEHQYMQNIQAPRSESSSTKKMYAGAGSLNSAFVFKIPVFDNMPEEGGAEEPEKPLQGISLDKETVTLRRPDTVVEDTSGLNETEKAENTAVTTLQVSFDPADTTSDKTVVWSSSDTKTVKVEADPADSSRAAVTAVGIGEAVVTAGADGKTAVCGVKVTAPIYRLELTDPGAEEGGGETVLRVGQSVNLNVEYWPKDTTSDKTIVWTSSDESTATVRNGRVTAQGAGKAVITAAAAGYRASHEVRVEACNVIFHKEDGTVWQTLSLSYGGCVADTGAWPEAQEIAGSIFRGWYTRENGKGSRFSADTPVYAGETHVYPYYQKTGGGFYAVPVGDQIYTGSAIKPKVQVFDGAVTPEGSLAGENDKAVLELVEGRDYTLSYRNNKKVNGEDGPRPTITVKGKGNYTGTEYVYFDILPKPLTDHDITAEDVTAAYNGKTIKSVPAVYRSGKKLAANRDYTVSYPQDGPGAYSRPGVYPVVITGKGGYTGKITVYEEITKDVLLSKVSVAKIPKQTYSDGQMERDGGIRPAALEVTYKGQPLVEKQDYTLSYSGDQGIGKATVTLTAVEGSGYAGRKSVTYQIVGTSISRATVEGIVNREFVKPGEDVGSAEYEREYRKVLQTPGTYSLTVDGRVLTESKDGITGDYVVSYAGAAKRGAVKAGTATIVFQGINGYSGQLKKTYRILPCEFDQNSVGSGRDVTLSYYTQDAPETVKELGGISGITTPYVKGGSKPGILVYFRGKELTPGKDYTVSYKNNKALTTADLDPEKLPAFTVKGKGNFKGSFTGNFTITDGRMGDKVAVLPKDVVYREKRGAFRAKTVLKDVDGATLAAGKDYDKNLRYTYEKDTEVQVLEGGSLSKAVRKAGDPVGEEDIPPVGTEIRVTAQGIGPYAGEGGSVPEKYAVYRVVTADFSKTKIKVSSKSYQEGRPVTLTAEDLAVTMNGVAEPLVYGKDYIIKEETYVNHTRKGKAKVTLQGIGNYGGEKTVTYTIGAKKLFWWI